MIYISRKRASIFLIQICVDKQSERKRIEDCFPGQLDIQIQCLLNAQRSVIFCVQIVLYQLLVPIFYSNYMKTVKTLLNCSVNLIELILQHRIEVRTTFLERCSAFLTKVQTALEKPKSKAVKQITSLEILENLIEHQLFFVRRKLSEAFKLPRNTYSSCLSFVLMEKSTSKIIKSQAWAFEFQKLEKPYQKADEKETASKSYKMILWFFQQILVSIKEQPLFKKFIGNQQLKRKFIIDYKLQTLNTNKNLNSLDGYSSMKESHLIENDYQIKMKCYFNNLCQLDSNLRIKQKNQSLQKVNEWVKSSKQRQTIDSDSIFSKKLSDEQAKSPRRMSIFQYYDENLQTHVISHDISSLSKDSSQDIHGRVQSYITTIEIQHQQDSDQVFEVLTHQQFGKLPDKGFLDDCQKQFANLISLEQGYFDQQQQFLENDEN